MADRRILARWRKFYRLFFVFGTREVRGGGIRVCLRGKTPEKNRRECRQRMDRNGRRYPRSSFIFPLHQILSKLDDRRAELMRTLNASTAPSILSMRSHNATRTFSYAPNALSNTHSSYRKLTASVFPARTFNTESSLFMIWVYKDYWM